MIKRTLFSVSLVLASSTLFTSDKPDEVTKLPEYSPREKQSPSNDCCDLRALLARRATGQVNPRVQKRQVTPLPQSMGPHHAEPKTKQKADEHYARLSKDLQDLKKTVSPQNPVPKRGPAETGL